MERALALFQPVRDDDLTYRFGHDEGVAAMLFLALALWPLGDIERAVSLVRSAEGRIAGLTHIATLAYGKSVAALFELMRGDLSLAAQNAVELGRVVREHDLPYWRAYQVFLEGWVKVQSGAHADGLADMRRGVELRREQSVLLADGQFKILLAEVEARSGDVDCALSIVDEALRDLRSRRASLF